MIDFEDDAILLDTQPFGASRNILHVLTRSHGRYAGLSPSGRKGPMPQPGQIGHWHWHARLNEHLGHAGFDVVRDPPGHALGDPTALLAIQALTETLLHALPERDPAPGVHDGLALVLQALDQPLWPYLLVRYEVLLLESLGHGLDLSRCAATGSNDQLLYVSPRSGRAVSASAGEAYADRLFPLPGFLTGADPLDMTEAIDGLHLTGYFLSRRVFHAANRPVPDSRARLPLRLAAAHGRQSSVPDALAMPRPQDGSAQG